MVHFSISNSGSTPMVQIVMSVTTLRLQMCICSIMEMNFCGNCGTTMCGRAEWLNTSDCSPNHANETASTFLCIITGISEYLSE